MNVQKIREHWASEISDMKIVSNIQLFHSWIFAWCLNNSSASAQEVENYARKCSYSLREGGKAQRWFHVYFSLLLLHPRVLCRVFVSRLPRSTSKTSRPESPIIIVIIYYIQKVEKRRKNIINYNLRFSWFLALSFIFNSMSDEIKIIKVARYVCARGFDGISSCGISLLLTIFALSHEYEFQFQIPGLSAGRWRESTHFTLGKG